MITREEILETINDLDEIVAELRTALTRGKGSTSQRLASFLDRINAEADLASDFLGLLNKIETQARVLRAMMIRHTRHIHAGLRKDGQRDMRFKSHRSNAVLDLRHSKV